MDRLEKASKRFHELLDQAEWQHSQLRLATRKEEPKAEPAYRIARRPLSRHEINVLEICKEFFV